MKLLVVSNMYPSKNAPSYGVFVRNFCTQLDELHIAYRLVAMRKAAGKLQKLFGYVWFFLRSFFACLLGRYDAVYVHYASHSSPGVLLARKLRKFTVYTNVHGSDVIPESAKKEKMQKYTRAVLSYSKKVIVPSRFFQKIVSEKYGIPEEQIFICPSGGVDTTLFRPTAVSRDSVFTLGFVGRLTAGKGWDILLQACALLPDRNFQLLLVGDGPEKTRMLQLLESTGLQKNTRLLGLQPQEKLAALYSSIDVFVFPTQLMESLGLVAVEAMACGTPVIASDYAAPADYVVDGFNGYKFPVGDPRKLADSLQQFRQLTADERHRLRDGALQTAARYSRQSCTDTLKTILLE